MINKP